MPVHAWGDSHEGTQIEVTSRKWTKISMGEIDTWASLKYTGHKTKPDGVNIVSNGHRMTLWCTKEKLDQMEAYK